MTTSSRRPRNAAATRQSLLIAAQDRFGAKGYESTTTREIGQAAGVDPALISRYFGSKADLYLAAVAAERLNVEGSVPPSSDDESFDDLAQVVEIVLQRTARLGPGPTLQALVRDDSPEEIRIAASARLTRRLVAPVAKEFADAGVDRPDLRAQVAVAALLGVALGRSMGWFDALASVDPDDLAVMITEVLRTE